MMSKDDDITYLGVEAEDEKKEQEPKKSKKPKEKKEKFKTNKHSHKLNKQIAGTKTFRISKKFVFIAIIIILIIIINPIKILQDTLDRKREYYSMIQEYNGDYDLHLDTLWNRIVYATGQKYYSNCRNVLIYPVEGQITAHYDFAHMAVDMQANTYPGTVYSAGDGVVYSVTSSKKYGNEILIEHTINDMKIFTFYGNLGTIMVAPGQTVSSSTPIATEGGSIEDVALTYDTEPHHVHFAVRKSPKESSGLNPVIFCSYR